MAIASTQDYMCVKGCFVLPTHSHSKMEIQWRMDSIFCSDVKQWFYFVTLVPVVVLIPLYPWLFPLRSCDRIGFIHNIA